jgi:hypothetical protein
VIKIVSKKADENGRVKVRVSANGRRHAVWAMPSSIVRNRVTGAYDKVLIGEPVERTIRIYGPDDQLVSEVVEMAPQVFVVAGASIKRPNIAA